MIRYCYRSIVWVMLICWSAAGCGEDDDVSSEEEARQAYLGLEQAIDQAMVLGLQGFAAATSAHIPSQTASGKVEGTITVGGKVDQGSSTNKEMRLTVELKGYSDDGKIIYDTSTPLPELEMSLKKIPNGDMTGLLTGFFQMKGELAGAVQLNLSLAAKLEQDPAGGNKIRRQAGTIRVQGTAQSQYGTYNVDVTH